MAVTWNEVNAAHLLRRAAFGGTAAEIAQAVSDGHIGAVNKLLAYDVVTTGDLDLRLSRQGIDLSSSSGIRYWWLTRLLFTPRPLEERMTLFWHDHWATSISKVGDAGYMFTQNQLLRRYALGNFINFAIDMSKDIAMLIWLDNITNRKGRANENYGRELLELFTLGIGNYTEEDVLACARSFTGWTYSGTTKTFVFSSANHDYGSKTLLGQTGDWNGDDSVRIACGKFAHGQLIARKLFSYFAYDNPEAAVVDRFARIYMDSGTNIRPLVEAILKSDEMFSPKALWSKVKGPVDHGIIASRQLLMDNDGLDNDLLGFLDAEGQTLFAPPDVDGWDGGLTWINSGWLLTRMNKSRTIISKYFDPIKFQLGATITNAAQMVDFYLKTLGPITLTAASRAELIKYVATDSATLPTGTTLALKQKGLARLILCLPDWQLY